MNKHLIKKRIRQLNSILVVAPRRGPWFSHHHAAHCSCSGAARLRGDQPQNIKLES